MKVIVNPHTVEVQKETINEKEINITSCEFEFSEEYTDDLVKKAYFTLENTTIEVLIQNNRCDIPHEALEKQGQVELGVVAYKIENDEYVKRYNPTPDNFTTWLGSLKEADNTEPITPSDKEQIEQLVTNALDEANTAVGNANTALNQANNLDLDVSKEDKTATVSITKKDGTQKSVNIFDGVSLQFMWQGTSLGVKTDDMQDYVFVDLQGIQGQPGPQGEAFQIKKTYATTELMIADYDNMNINDYVMISGDIETQENATLWVKTETEDPTYRWVYLADFSGASGIQGETGATPQISIGTVTSGETPSVTISGTAEHPVFNFVLVKGATGATGQTGATGATGNGISSIEKTNETPSQSDYRINYTNGGYFDYSVLNGEVTKSQLEMLENALPHVSGTGTSITLNNTAQYPMKNVLNPSELSQETTTGANLFNNTCTNETVNGVAFTLNSDKTITLSGTSNGSITKTIGTFTGTSDVTYWLSGSSGSASTYYLNLQGVINQQGTANSFTGDGTAHNLRIYVASGVNCNGVIIKPMINTGSSATSYEPYTGGIPQPNPSYPSDVHVISGDNTIKVSNANLIDFENYMENVFASNKRTKLDDGGWEISANDTRYALYEGFLQAPLTLSFLAKNNDSSTTDTSNRTFSFRIHYDDGTYETLTFTTNNTYQLKTFNIIKNVIKIDNTYTRVSPLTIIKNVMLNYGSSALDYLPHQEQVKPLNLPVENLINKSQAPVAYASSTYLELPTGFKAISTSSSQGVGIFYIIGKYTDLLGKSITISYNATPNKTENNVNMWFGTMDSQNTINRTKISDNYVGSGKRTRTVKITSDYSTYDSIYIYFSSIGLNSTNREPGDYVEYADVMVEIGDKANSYTPYGTTPIEYCKIGNYEDKFMKPSGSNLFNKDSGFVLGYINSSGTFVSEIYTALFNQYIEVEEQSNYIIGFNQTIRSFNVIFYNENKVFLSRGTGWSNSQQATFQTPTNCKYILVQFSYKSDTTMTQEIIDSLQCMLNEGSTALPYEPYNDGKWYIQKNIGKVVFNGSESWTLASAGDIRATTILSLENVKLESPSYSNYFSSTGDNSLAVSPSVQNRIILAILNSIVGIEASDNNFVRNQKVKTWLSTHNTDFYFQADTPTYIPLNDTLQQQLDDIYNTMLSYQGQTNISQDNNDLPFDMTGSALKDLSNL